MKKFSDKINESIEDRIPTAEEFFSNDSMGLSDENYDWLAYDSVVKKAKEFVKLHVEKALEEANRCIIESDDLQSDCESGRFNIKDVYPLDDIK
jgi:hypothetical protein